MIYGQENFHLKFGFSNILLCLNHLLRMEPFTSLFVDANGDLEDPNRLFSNVAG